MMRPMDAPRAMVDSTRPTRLTRLTGLTRLTRLGDQAARGIMLNALISWRQTILVLASREPTTGLSRTTASQPRYCARPTMQFIRR